MAKKLNALATIGILLCQLDVVSGQARELYSDTWVATDSMGRTISTYDDVGPLRENKTVGMFYFLWHGAHGTDLYDNTQILQTNPTNPQYGPVNSFHWWGEPEAGYYRANDPWVIRRNASMLVDAGIDFLYIDVSNAFTYLNEFRALASTYEQIRSEGGKTPQIAFLTRSNSPATIQRLYDDIYSRGIFQDLWFQWQGKPLMLGYPDQDGNSLAQPARDFFTFRESWAWDAGQRKWQWIDDAPQDYGWDINPLRPEQIPAAVASHPTRNVGTSYSNGQQPAIDQYGLTPTTGEGHHFTEQIDHALQVDPSVLFITGWNEWVAQRKLSDGTRKFLGQTLPAGETYFVDAYNQEFNRDIEPMKGGHTDNYYYQLVDAVRRYKGVSTLQTASSKTISINGDFTAWSDVSQEFRDTLGDTAHRDWEGWGGLHYTNTTGRNDFVTAKVTNDNENAYFYMETADSITPYTDQNWMMLYLDTDQDSTTGWNGYDFVVNRDVLDSGLTTLQHTLDGVSWDTVGLLEYAVTGNRMELSIPLELIDELGANVSFYFHWADNTQSLDDISEFFVHGDSAPNRRFNYHYESLYLGDVDGDEDVDLIDKSIIRDNLFESGHARSGGDLNGDGIVDFDDFREWKERYDLAMASTSVVVPEPLSAVLAAGCLFLCLVDTRIERRLRDTSKGLCVKKTSFGDCVPGEISGLKLGHFCGIKFFSSEREYCD